MYIQISKFMGGNIFIFVLLMLLPLVDSSRPWKMLTMNLGGEANLLYSWTIFSSGVFVLVASVLSVFLIIQHLAVYKQPELWDPECFLLCLIRLPVFNPSQEQKFLIGLILMVPVYAVSSFLSLAYTEIAFVYEVLRDCYEAFAMYCFERYLIACLGGEENTIKLMETQSEISSSTPLLELEYADGLVRHPFPLNCFMKHWYLGTEFYESVKIAIVQYMILKTVCALLAIILELLGVYGEGKFKWNYGYPYLAVILNFSQTWALYCLVQFYSVTKHKLEPIKPLAKFLVFKSIVFLTWWQGVAIAFLFSIGTLKGHLAQLLKTRIQDYIICIEMGIAAVVHLYVFPAKPYHRGERCVRNVAVMTDYASLGTPVDPEEVEDCGRSPRVHIAPPDDSERLLSFPQSVRDVLFGSGEIVVDDVKFTVSHVVEPVERGIAKINKTLHQISENVKQHERSRRKAKDDTSFVPLDSWREECFDAHLVEGSYSDSGRPSSKKWQANAKSVGSRRGSFEFSGSRWL